MLNLTKEHNKKITSMTEQEVWFVTNIEATEDFNNI